MNFDLRDLLLKKVFKLYSIRGSNNKAAIGSQLYDDDWILSKNVWQFQLTLPSFMYFFLICATNYTRVIFLSTHFLFNSFEMFSLMS